MSAGIGGILSGQQFNQLAEMAKYARGSYLFNRSSGAEGIMGSYTEGGKTHYIKMLTHSNERSVLKAPNAEADLIGSNGKLETASASLKNELLELARTVGVDGKLNELFGGKKNKFETLMSRKIVAQAISLISKAHNANRAATEAEFRKRNAYGTFFGRDYGEVFSWKSIKNADVIKNTTIDAILKDVPDPEADVNHEPPKLEQQQPHEEVEQESVLPAGVKKEEFNDVCQKLTIKFLSNMDPKKIDGYSRWTEGGVIRKADLKEIEDAFKDVKENSGPLKLDKNYTDFDTTLSNVFTYRENLWCAKTLEGAQEAKHKLNEAVNGLNGMLKKIRGTISADVKNALTNALDAAEKLLANFKPKGNDDEIEGKDMAFFEGLLGKNFVKEVQDKVSSAVVDYHEKNGTLPNPEKIMGMEGQELKVQEQSRIDERKALQTKKKQLEDEISLLEHCVRKDADVEKEIVNQIAFLEYLELKLAESKGNRYLVMSKIGAEVRMFTADPNKLKARKEAFAAQADLDVTKLELDLNEKRIKLDGLKRRVGKEEEESNREIVNLQNEIGKAQSEYDDAKKSFDTAKGGLDYVEKQISQDGDRDGSLLGEKEKYQRTYDWAKIRFDNASKKLEDLRYYEQISAGVRKDDFEKRINPGRSEIKGLEDEIKGIESKLDVIRKDKEFVDDIQTLASFWKDNSQALVDGKLPEIKELKNQRLKQILKDKEDLVKLQDELRQVEKSILQLRLEKSAS